MEFRSYSKLQSFISQKPRYEYIGYITNKTILKWNLPIPTDTPDIKYIYQNGNNFCIYNLTQNVNPLTKYYS